MERHAPTLLGRIARHPVGIDRDAREDRLTEVVAAVLDSPHCEGLARFVAMGWLGEAGEHHRASAERDRFRRLHARLADDTEGWECEIDTQRTIWIDGRRRPPDLELCFTCARAQPLTLRVEVKHGTDPHTHQLFDYVHELRGADDDAVLLLAPRGDLATFDEAQVPDEVVRISWQDTARAVREWPLGDDDHVARFLVEELSHYLEEEDLVDPAELTPEDIVALVRHHRALDALDRLCELASQRVERDWNDLEPEGHGCWPPTRPRERWWRYPSQRRGDATGERALWESGDWGFNWQLLYDGSYLCPDASPGVPLLMAGMTGSPGGVQALGERRRDRLLEEEFALLPVGTTTSTEWEYVTRVRELGYVLTGGPLDEQADRLAHWVTETFTDLTEALRIEG